MADRIGLNNLVFTVNNVQIPYKPNSLSFNDGKGEYKTRAMTAGGGAVDVIYTIDAESKLAKIKCSVESTDYMVDLYNSWKDQVFVAISLVGSKVGVIQDTFSRYFNQMTLLTNAEIKASADGEFEIEFSGSPVV
jgi:hypothetical protein